MLCVHVRVHACVCLRVRMRVCLIFLNNNQIMMKQWLVSDCGINFYWLFFVYISCLNHFYLLHMRVCMFAYTRACVFAFMRERAFTRTLSVGVYLRQIDFHLIVFFCPKFKFSRIPVVFESYSNFSFQNFRWLQETCLLLLASNYWQLLLDNFGIRMKRIIHFIIQIHINKVSFLFLEFLFYII